MHFIIKDVAINIQRAINALFSIYQMETQNGKLVDNPYNDYIRLQDWTFTQRSAQVKKSCRPKQ